MLPHEQGETQMLAQRAAAFLQQQQQQLMAEDYTEDCTSAGAAHPATASKPMLGSAAAVAVGVSLQRLASSDDSSNSRIIEASSSGGAGCGSGYDNSWGPSISSGSGSGSDERGYQQQQQHVQQLHQPPEPCAAYPAAAAAAASQLPPAVKLERTEQQPQDQQLQQQHPQAGQLLWQHMLLQHLQQHVQQAPGFSLPELISVAAALFGNKVDTLVSAFGLPGAAAGDSCSNSSSVHAQMAELVSSLKQADTAQAPAAADGGAAPVYLPRQ
jgi:hypothetical protein